MDILSLAANSELGTRCTIKVAHISKHEASKPLAKSWKAWDVTDVYIVYINFTVGSIGAPPAPRAPAPAARWGP